MTQSIRYKDKKIISIRNNAKVLTLTWIINNICTNHCSYCPSYLHNGSNHHYDWAQAKAFIEECFRRYGNIKCNIAGGEPTVSPFYKDLISLIYDNGGTVHVSTNLVRSIDWWSDIVDKSASIGASYHPEFIVTPDDEDGFIDKVQFLSGRTSTQVRVMMHPGLWDRAYNFYNKLKAKDLPIHIELVRISPNFGGGDTMFFSVNYTDDQLNILSAEPLYSRSNKKLPITFRQYPGNSSMNFDDGTSEIMTGSSLVELYNTNVLDFRGWNCNIGLESIFVSYDGLVFKGNCVVDGQIGTLMTDIEWPTKSVICNKKECHCAADVEITKSIT